MINILCNNTPDNNLKEEEFYRSINMILAVVASSTNTHTTISQHQNITIH